MDLSKFFDFLKLSPRVLLALLVCGVFLLFPKNPLITLMGLGTLSTNYKTYIGLVTLLSGALLISYLAESLSKSAESKRKKSSNLKKMEEDLSSLTPQEKIVLRGYIHDNTKTQTFDLSNGIVGNLAARGILYRSSNAGYAMEFAYSIQPWAWKYLRTHPDVLNDTPIEKISNKIKGASTD